MRKLKTKEKPTSESVGPLSTADALRRARRQVGGNERLEGYLLNATIAARALTLLLPDQTIDEENVEFEVAFVGFNVPSPAALVRSYLEANDLELPEAANRTSSLPSTSETFVFGHFNDTLIVLPRSVAEDCARMHQALSTCATWGELRKLAPEGLYRQAVELLGRTRMPPGRDVERDLDALQEESFPPDSGALMQLYLPDSCQAFLSAEENALGEQLYSIAAAHEPAILAKLASLGIDCVEDLNVIERAVGSVV